jgi:hypothetical protein
MTTTYTPPREPRDRTRTAAAKRRTLEMRAARRAKFLAVAL